MSEPADPFTPDDEYATLRCPQCGFEWEQLLLFEDEDQPGGWPCSSCGELVTIADEIDVSGQNGDDESAAA